MFCTALFGALIGFLWYNAHPAQVFMGDTGSLALGGALGAIAILLKCEFLLLLIGGVFVAETFSVIVQRTVFKYRRRKYGLEYAKSAPGLPASTAAPSLRAEGVDRDAGGGAVLDPRHSLRVRRAHHAQNPMIPRAWRQGEIAVVGLGASGRAASELLLRDNLRVYASDASSSDAAQRAAAALGRLGATVQTGGHDLARIARAAVVVASPGVPPDAPPLVRARSAGVPVVSEIEVGLRYLAATTRYIAITGTNGKTTTTAMVGHLLRALGLTAVDAGNIGTPLTEIALAAAPPAWVALEVSSFQLHDTPSIAPAVGVLTNLSPDHLDRYPSVAAYYADKALLVLERHGNLQVGVERR